MEHGNLKELRAIDLDSSDNLSEEMLQKFITVYGPQLHGMYLDDFFGFNSISLSQQFGI